MKTYYQIIQLLVMDVRKIRFKEKDSNASNVWILTFAIIVGIPEFMTIIKWS